MPAKILPIDIVVESAEKCVECKLNKAFFSFFEYILFKIEFFFPDLKSMMSLSLSRSSSTGSFSKEYSSSHYNNSNNGSHRKHHKRSPSSDESGIEDKSTISVSDKSSSVNTSMISSAATPLSPVHEVRESPKHTARGSENLK